MEQREGRIQSAERAVPTFSFQASLRTFFQPDSGGLQAHLGKEGRNGCQAARGSPEPRTIQETSERAGQSLSIRTVPANPLIPKWLIPRELIQKSFSESKSII